MRSWSLFLTCAIPGLLLFVCGWLIPAHLRAVDSIVIEKAGAHTHSVVGSGISLVNLGHVGAAKMLSQAARARDLPAESSLEAEIARTMAQPTASSALGGPEPLLESMFGLKTGASNEPPVPFTDFVLRRENQEKAMAFLDASSVSLTKELMQCRELTNTVIFSPSHSSSGEAFDAALTLCGLLVETAHVTPGLSNAVSALAAQAIGGGDTRPLEQVMLDLMSLGQRFNWDQLAVFVGRIGDADTLRTLVNAMQQAPGSEAAIFSAVELSGEPRQIAVYLNNYPKTGVADVSAGLRAGSGGVTELVRRNERLYDSDLRRPVAAWGPFQAIRDFAVDYCWRMPEFSLILKWLLYLAAGFLLAASLHFARPETSALEQPLQVRGFHMAREFLFALGFLLVVLVLTEPFLAQDSQKMALPIQLHLSMPGGAVQAGNHGAQRLIMNEFNASNIWTMLVFFVLQALLYTSCLLKLAEIRRQRVPPRVKLRLLENEDLLFDAGLYLGFLGTVVSFILVSLSVAQKLNLMVAYSSTSFGIIFVCIFKICHLRPERRRLVMESESVPVEPAAPIGRAYAATPAP
jgi:hypothetical protein